MNWRIDHAAYVDAAGVGGLPLLATYGQAHGQRINELLRDAIRNPFEGLGKPEPLRFDLAGCWSRRINQEDRLVYKVDEGSAALIVLQCRYHY